MGDPQVTMGLNTKSLSNNLDDVGYPHDSAPGALQCRWPQLPHLIQQNDPNEEKQWGIRLFHVERSLGFHCSWKNGLYGILQKNSNFRRELMIHRLTKKL